MNIIVSCLADLPSISKSLKSIYHISMLYLLLKRKEENIRALNFLERVCILDVTLTESCTAYHFIKVSKIINDAYIIIP